MKHLICFLEMFSHAVVTACTLVTAMVMDNTGNDLAVILLATCLPVLLLGVHYFFKTVKSKINKN